MSRICKTKQQITVLSAMDTEEGIDFENMQVFSGDELDFRLNLLDQKNVSQSFIVNRYKNRKEENLHIPMSKHKYEKDILQEDLMVYDSEIQPLQSKCLCF
ncbi:hypothetical protein AVEN_70842-1 [Araneus ventricosus]|uniref:Uncharacterized protein n=1 Tax=Araneus ventricosus TaxID=182803 RepID=A0A4Y2HJC0_ARAVE|nr:hypothetical protein AVEN_70842-1 [Araneus ventricosus]